MSEDEIDFSTLERPDWFALVFSAIVIGVVSTVSLFGYVLPSLGEFLDGHRFDWFRILVVFLFFVVAPVLGITRSFINSQININDQRLSIRSLHGRKAIYWKDVVSVQRVGGSVINLASQSSSLKVDLDLFQNPDELSEFIEKSVEIYEEA